MRISVQGVLAAVPTPPKFDSNSAWGTAIVRTKSRRLVGWVQMTGSAGTMKKEDVDFWASGIDVGRSNLNVSSHTCLRYRDDHERTPFLTLALRTAGSEMSGDYFVLAALGVGFDSKPATRKRLTAVSLLTAQKAAIGMAQELLGEPFETIEATVNGWHEALGTMSR